MKKFLLVFMTCILVVPSFFVTASTNDRKAEEVTASGETGIISSKDEVVYAKLDATGERQEIYVVNILDVEKAGKVTDYGPYVSLKNLTDLATLEQKGSNVEFEAPKGKFYYQGNMTEEALPWDVSISYWLNGKEVLPNELAGQEGHVQIQVQTAANERVNPVFFQNYLLQISLPLSLDLFSNIQAPNGMLANAGKNKQVTFTVMPEKEERFVIEADTVGFELEGIDITAVPASLAFDTPDIDKMISDMQLLTDAIEKVNSGVGELKDGVSDLNDGVNRLRDGSQEYKDGIMTIDGSSAELVNASLQIGKALDTLDKSLRNNSGDMGIGDLKKLADGISQISGGLKETSTGLTTLQENYVTASNALNKAMGAIPEHEITSDKIQQLYASGADQTVLNQLVETYTAARTAKGTYAAVNPAFEAVNGALRQTSDALKEMSNQLDTMAKGLESSLSTNNSADSIAQLQQGINTLSTNYKKFHSGLAEYTVGLHQLSSAYKEMHNGMVELAEGTGELEDGVSKLHDGTTELYDSTSDLPVQMREEVNNMMSDFDKSDFEAVSFVSPQNENINLVQFVFKTESIKVEKTEETVHQEEEVKGFWARFKELFR